MPSTIPFAHPAPARHAVILEGLVTTTVASGDMHVAAIGPTVDDRERWSGPLRRLVLRPFPGSQTASNLLRSRAGVFHAVDDVLLVARIVAGRLDGRPAARPAESITGFVLADACRAWEFQVDAVDDSAERLWLAAQVVREHAGRPFLGFNRAAHAIVEAAILVTRLHLSDAVEVQRQFRDLEPLVAKTGGPREREAFDLLAARLADSPIRGIG